LYFSNHKIITRTQKLSHFSFTGARIGSFVFQKRYLWKFQCCDEETAAKFCLQTNLLCGKKINGFPAFSVLLAKCRKNNSVIAKVLRTHHSVNDNLAIYHPSKNVSDRNFPCKRANLQVGQEKELVLDFNIPLLPRMYFPRKTTAEFLT